MISKCLKLLKTSSSVILLTGGGWIYYQVYRVKFMFNHICRPEVLENEKKRSEYIYIDDATFTEEMDLFKEEKHSHGGIFERMPIVCGWRALKHTLAWHLLSMAQGGDRSDRLKAVHSLANMKDLTDSDYRQVAQACDARTAVGLARTRGVDLRFFLEPPYSHVTTSYQEVIESLRKLFHELISERPHPCIDYFLSRAFPEFQHRYKILDLDVSSNEGSHSGIRYEDLLLLCLRNLLHHSAIGENAKAIASKGGLAVLMTIYKQFGNNKEISVVLAPLLANISGYQDMLEDIHRSGWIRILALWSQDDDIRLAVPAAKALCNLDKDGVPRVKYPRRIYLLHPVWRRTYRPKMDVVFVHGLLGGIFVTWRQRDRDLRETETDDESSKSTETKSSETNSSETKSTEAMSTEVMSTEVMSAEVMSAEAMPTEAKSPIGETCDGMLVDIDLSLTRHCIDEQIQEYFDCWQEEWEEVGRDFEMILDDLPVDSKRQSEGPFFLSSFNPYAMQGTAHHATESTRCWPKDWLPKDCPHLRILGVNYDTSLSMWGPMCPCDSSRGTLSQRSEEIINKLLVAGVGDRPVIWVTHSMGGLLVKNMLVKAWESENPKLQRLCKNSKAILFYSVPHRGSPLAALAPTTQFFLWPTIEVRELREDSASLLGLHNQFMSMLDDVPMQIVSFGENKATAVPTLRMKFFFVPPSSADPGVGEFYQIPQDHLCICKPANRESFLYQKLLQVICDIMDHL